MMETDSFSKSLKATWKISIWMRKTRVNGNFFDLELLRTGIFGWKNCPHR